MLLFSTENINVKQVDKPKAVKVVKEDSSKTIQELIPPERPKLDWSIKNTSTVTKEPAKTKTKPATKVSDHEHVTRPVEQVC